MGQRLKQEGKSWKRSILRYWQLYILLIPVIAALVLPPVAIEMLGFLYLVVGFSSPAYGASRILRNIFDRVNGATRKQAPPTSEE